MSRRMLRINSSKKKQITSNKWFKSSWSIALTSLMTAVLLSVLCTVYYAIETNLVEIDQIESIKVQLN